jgi:hypothetical protein
MHNFDDDDDDDDDDWCISKSKALNLRQLHRQLQNHNNYNTWKAIFEARINLWYNF